MVSSVILEEKLPKLVGTIVNKKAIVAFSGGLDSTLLLLLASKYSNKVIPVFFYGPMFTREELAIASEFCKILKIQLEILDFNPLNNKKFSSNPSNRCYYCKKSIMKSLKQVQEEVGFDIIIEGTNTSDLNGHRPGYKALEEMEVISPYIFSRISKPEIESIIQYIIQNPSWILPNDTEVSSYELSQFLKKIIHLSPNPCLCSRIDYGIEITEDFLSKIYKAEQYLRDTFHLRSIRVRLHEHNLIRIEIPKYQMINILTTENIKQITETMKGLGFTYVTLDLEGFRSGSLDHQ